MLITRRGLPLGYVNRLEARLAETEAALLYVLGHKHHGDASTSSQSEGSSEPGRGVSASAANTKDDRIKEWDRLPLQSASDVQSWYRWKTGDSSTGSPPAAMGSSRNAHSGSIKNARMSRDSPRNSAAAGAPQAWLEAGELSQAVPGPPASAAAAMTTPPTAPSDATPAPWEASAGRAKRLSESQKSLYF